MSRFVLRITLLIVCMAAIGGAAAFYWFSSRDAARTASALREFHLHARATAVAIADLRAAQQSYVAAGQGEDFWFVRVTAIKNDVDTRLASMRALTRSPEAIAELEAAAAALNDFTQMDARAREYTRGRQLALASDMIFGDGFDLTKRAGDAVERAANAAVASHDTGFVEVRRQQELTLAGAGGLAALGLLLLVPGARRVEPEQPATLLSPSRVPPTSMLSDLNDFGVVAKPIPPAPSRVDLDQMATVCVDLARLADTRALPSLLERTASVLDASGIVLWIADPDGRELSPIVVHGYPPHLATRMGTILRDAENVTAAAFRTGLTQTMKADTISNGAIAVPLVASAGCVGVMAAEMKNGGEQHHALLAAATVIAAQLATLVGPPSTRAKAEAAS
jgi:hypothetical protein